MNILIAQLDRYRRLLTLVIVLGMIGFTTYQISLITSVQADQTYLAQQKAATPAVKLKPNPNTIKLLQELQPAGDTAIPIVTGKSDPFSLN